MRGQTTSVPDNQLSELLAEIPVELFFLVCGASMALVVYLMWFTYSRSKRSKATETTASIEEPYSIGTVSEEATQSTDPRPLTRPDPNPLSADMPELDFLLDTTTFSEGLNTMDEPTQQPLSSPIPFEPIPGSKPGPNLVELNTGEVIEAQEVITVLRDPRDGRLVVKIDGVAYRSLVASPDVKKKFVKIMKQLSEVVTQPDASAPAQQDQQPDIPEPAPEIQPESARPEPPAAPATPAAASPISGPPPLRSDGTMPGDLPSFKLDDNKPPEGKDEKPAPIPELDLAGAIEAYLQHKLDHTPHYADREIHVKPALHGGVLIQVDNEFYDSVDEVAETEIRDFLRVTIQEWQDRQNR